MTADHGGRRERAAQLVRDHGADALLVGDPGSVAWLTGHVTAIDTGPSPFAIGPFAMIDADGAVVLLASEDEAAPDGVDVRAYPGFGLAPIDRLAAARTAAAPLVEGRRLAIDAAVPAGLVAAARSRHDAETAVMRARAVKDADEIALLRQAVALCDAGQAAVRAAVLPGVSELELWSAARLAIDTGAGAPTPLLADMVTGPRTAEIGGPATGRTVQEGELVLCDLVPHRETVWGDSCATVAVGEPSAWARAAHRRAMDSLDAAIEAIRPGIFSGDLDAIVRDALGDLPHHVGHGLGCAYHEEPRIVPGGRTRLEPGMAVAIEPGIYGEAEGLRVERVMLITDDGCEVLSAHDLAL